MSKGLSIIIPVYNEQGVIDSTLKQINENSLAHLKTFGVMNALSAIYTKMQF